MKTPPLRRDVAAACLAFALLQPGLAAAQAADAPFARVGDTVITQQQFDAAFAQAARGRFYHGKTPEGEAAKLQREVAQALVDDVLVAREARQRNLRPDAAAVARTIASYEARYQDSAQWQANRAQLLPGLVAKLEQDSVREQLAAQVKAVADPTPAQLQRFYETHPDKFTSPEQLRLRMILLKVDPSSPQAQWDGAKQEGAAIVARLKKGADFGELARLHSSDASAAQGGDLGIVHRGMLPDAAQEAVDRMKPGDTSEPVVVLEGVAVLRLAERRPPVLNALAAVRERARDLYRREKGEEAWNALLARLRREQPAKFDESRFLPLAAAGGGPPAR